MSVRIRLAEQYTSEVKQFMNSFPIESDYEPGSGATSEENEEQMDDIASKFQTAAIRTFQYIDWKMEAQRIDIDYEFLSREHLNIKNNKTSIEEYIKLLLWDSYESTEMLSFTEKQCLREISLEEKVLVFTYFLQHHINQRVEFKIHLKTKEINEEIAELTDKLNFKTDDYNELQEKFGKAEEDILLRDGKIFNLTEKIKEIEKKKKRNFFMQTILPMILSSIFSIATALIIAYLTGFIQ